MDVQNILVDALDLDALIHATVRITVAGTDVHFPSFQKIAYSILIVAGSGIISIGELSLNVCIRREKNTKILRMHFVGIIYALNDLGILIS